MTTGIEFEEDNFSKNYARPAGSQQSYSYNNYNSDQQGEKGMTGWLMRHGLAKSPQGAQMVMLGIIIINMIITGVFLFYLL